MTGETVEIRSVPVTSLHRTLLDLCAWTPSVEALVVIDMAVRMRLVSTDELRDYAKGRAGAARLRSLAAIQNSLVRAGYHILRFTSADIYGRPHVVAAAVRGYLSGR